MSIAIKGYRITEKIDEGSMGEVYKAKQISLDRFVAIKVLRHEYYKDTSAIDQFKREANSIARLKHKNIVQIYEAGQADNLYYFIMEYVSGYDLAQLINREIRLSEEKTIFVAESIAQALDYAWSTVGLIHCDLKPSNILIDGDGFVKITDFSGLMKALSFAHKQKDSDVIIGTPNYMSPEQVRGVQDLDYRSDIYSLGCLMYHLVTGIMPFGKTSPREAMDCQLTDFLENPKVLNANVSSFLAALIEKMMIKDRDRRDLNWKQVLDDVNRVKNQKKPRGTLSKSTITTIKRLEDAEKPALKVKEAPIAVAAEPVPVAVKPVMIKEKKGKDVAPVKSSTPIGMYLKPLVPFVVILLLLGGAYGSYTYVPNVRKFFDQLLQGEETVMNSQDAGPEDAVQLAQQNNAPVSEPDNFMEPDNTFTEPETNEPDEPNLVEDEPQDDGSNENIMSYLNVMASILTKAKNGDHAKSMRELSAWLEKHPNHPYAANARNELALLKEAVQVVDAIEGQREKLEGRDLTGKVPRGSNLYGKIISVNNGVITVIEKVGAEGIAQKKLNLGELSKGEMEMVVKLTSNPNDIEKNLATLMIAKGDIEGSKPYMIDMVKGGQNVDALESWARGRKTNVKRCNATLALKRAKLDVKRNNVRSAENFLQYAKNVIQNDSDMAVAMDDVEQVESSINKLTRQKEDRSQKPAKPEIDERRIEAILDL